MRRHYQLRYLPAVGRHGFELPRRRRKMPGNQDRRIL